MASFLSCRASCSDFNVVRHCSHTVPLSSSTKRCFRKNSEVKVIATATSHPSTTENRLCTKNVQAAAPTSPPAVNSKWNWNVLAWSNSNSSAKTSMRSFHNDPGHKMNMMLSSIAPLCGYHTFEHKRTCSICYKLRFYNNKSNNSNSYVEKTQRQSRCYCSCSISIPVFYNHQSPFVLPRRFFSVGKKRSHTHYYDVLGLTSRATQKQIKTAYYGLSKKFHPDVSQDKKNHAIFTEISEAYEVLGNIQKRRLYDKGMFSQRGQRGYDDRDYEEEDYTQSYKQKTNQSPFERGSRPPPPTGRSKIYNFDEFYKQHYNEMRVRRKTEFDAFQKHKEMNSSSRQRSQHDSLGSSLVMSLFFTVLLIAVYVNDRLRDRDRLYKDKDRKDG